MTGGDEIEIGRAIRGAAPYADDAERRREDADTADLVARIQGGEREAFAQVYERYFDSVYGYLRIVLRDPHEAEDVAQQVFMKALEALQRYRQRRQPFRAWLFVIARNLAISQLRKRGRVEPEDPAELEERRERSLEPELGALRWISDGDLLLFVERLPTAQRQVLALRYMLDLRTGEIAEILGRRPNDVSKLQHRALRFLEQRLRAVGREPRSRQRRLGWRPRHRQAVVLRERRFSLIY
ncbi:MAG: RNA polymerase sigma factor [Solirubrobacterales bacterium]